MRWSKPLVEGRLLRRYKRFLADVRLTDGREVVAHCPNPGSMTGYNEGGTEVWLSRAPVGAKRKLAWTWELAREGRAYVMVNTLRSNALVEEALRRGRVPELSTSALGPLRREVRHGDSRFDFCFGTEVGRRTFVEVKSVTLRDRAGARRALFPDAVTARGTRHLRGLMELQRRGERAALLFLLCRSDCDEVAPADLIDPVYGATLRRAFDAGVEVLAVRARIRQRGLGIDGPVPVVLG
jgi:sugar fermentation stimulation protein A